MHYYLGAPGSDERHSGRPDAPAWEGAWRGTWLPLIFTAVVDAIFKRNEEICQVCGENHKLLATTIENVLTKKTKLGHVLWKRTDSHTRAELIIENQYGQNKNIG